MSRCMDTRSAQRRPLRVAPARRASAAALAALGLTAVVAAQRDPVAWQEMNPPTAPPARALAAMAFDTTRNEAVLFGGDTGTVALNDTWVWNGSGWQQRVVAGPPARLGHAMTYDPRRGRVVLFGGVAYHRQAMLGDLWEWDGVQATWRMVPFNPTTGPAPREGHKMTFDAARGVVVMFGGNKEGVGLVNETWTWDGTNWAQQLPTVAPGPRTRHGLAYDVARRRVVTFGGRMASGQTDTVFEWDGTQWHNVVGVPSGIASREGHVMEYDALRARTVVFGGANELSILSDTWEWNGTDWFPRNVATPSPSTRVYAASAYDPATQSVVMFGGAQGMSLPLVPFGDTWRYLHVAPATYATFGAGCPGSNQLAPTIRGTRPWMGEPFTCGVDHALPIAPGLLRTGFSRTNWLGFGLPLNLAMAGAPLCDILTSAAINEARATDPLGSADLGFVVPIDPTLMGGRFYQQWVIIDLTANALGIVLSDGGEGRIASK